MRQTMEAIKKKKENKEKAVILAIDDKPEILATLTEMLDGVYTVIGATSYRSATAIMERRTPDLFLLDIEMPDVDGYDIAALIRANDDFRHIPILFLTGNATKGAVVKAAESGGSAYIIKPVRRGILLRKIRQYLS